MRASKQQELVEKAMAVFYRHGFAATGMERLVEETGISKRSMYNYFGTKEALIVAVLRHRDRQFCDWLTGRVEALAVAPGERLLAIFDALDEWFTEPGFQGCLFIKAAAEFQQKNDPVRAEALAHKRLLHRYFRKLAKAAGAHDPSLVARRLLVIKDGAIVAAEMGYNKRAARDARQLAAVMLRQEGVIR